MSLKKAVLVGAALWIVTIGALHAWLNLDLFRRRIESSREFKVGFLPVT